MSLYRLSGGVQGGSQVRCEVRESVLTCWFPLARSRPGRLNGVHLPWKVRKCSCVQNPIVCAVSCVFKGARFSVMLLVDPPCRRWSMDLDLVVQWFGVWGTVAVVQKWSVPDPGVHAHGSSYLINLDSWRLPQNETISSVYHTGPLG